MVKLLIHHEVNLIAVSDHAPSAISHVKHDSPTLNDLLLVLDLMINDLCEALE